MIAGAAVWERHALKTALSQGRAVALQRPMQAFLSIGLLAYGCRLR